MESKKITIELCENGDVSIEMQKIIHNFNYEINFAN